MAKKIEIEIAGEAAGLRRAVKESQSALGGLGSGLGRLAKVGVLAAGAAGLGAVAITLRTGISEWKESAKVTAQTEAVLKSTGGSANITAKQVDNLATSIMRKTGIDDEAVKSGENMLLTFTNIRNEAGRGNDVFNQSTKILADMSTALGTDMNKSAIQLGKALNDPIKGVTALTKVGVTFTQGQKDQIKAMVEAGDTMGAQKLILAELNREFGGSAEAIGKTLPGQLSILKESFNNFAGDLVGRVAPALQHFVGFLNDIAAAKGFQAKVDVVVGEVKNLAERAAQIGLELGSKIKDVLVGTDWGDVGAKIGAAISKAITVTTEFMDGALTAALGWVNSHAGQLGNVGALMLVTMVVALTDPAFWAEHWQLAAGVILLAAGGPLGKAAGKIGELLMKTMGDTVVRVAPEFALKLFFVVDDAIQALQRLGLRLGLVITGVMVTGMRAIVEQVGPWVSAAFAVGQAVVNAIRGALEKLGGIVHGALNAIPGIIRGFAAGAASAGFSIGAAIVQGIGSGIKSLVGGIAAQAADAVRGIVDAMKRAARIGSPSELTERLIGRPLAEGIIVGFLGSHLKEALLGHVQEAKQGIDDFVGSIGVANMAAQGMMMGAAYRSSLAAAMAGVTQPAIAGTPWMPMGRSGPIAEPRVRSLSPDGAVVYNTSVNVNGFVGSEHRLADEITSLLQRRAATGGGNTPFRGV